MSWEDIAASKRKQLADSIPAEWRIPPDKLPAASQLDVTSWPRESGFFTDRELEITALSATELLGKLHSSEWTSEEVTRAFCKRAAVAHQLTNCLTVIFFDDAITNAKRLDERLKSTGQTVGPLHGLPISLKDNFEIEGHDSTVGFVAWVNQPATTNTILVDILDSLGAVKYVKTNVPTAMMIAETVNNVFGRTTNPLNRNLTSGGSSGGESALIAFHGSALGVGTDIGGSLRIPAACTGIFTLRPSHGRFPTAGSKSGLVGQEAVMSVNGPMARTLDDIELFASAVIGTEPWRMDPKCLPIPWRKVQVKNKLKIGVMWTDGTVTPTPPVSRTLKQTVEKLKGAGHTLVDWSPESNEQLMQLLNAFFVADGGKTLQSILDVVREPIRPELKPYEDASEIGVAELWKLQGQRMKLIIQHLKRWQDAGIDCILCPTTPYAAPEHTKFKWVGYTGIFNVVDYSALSFPSGVTADQNLDAEFESKERLPNGYDEAARNDYDATAVHGMPVSLQLVAQRLEEEKAIEMLRIVMQSLSQ